MSKKRKTKKQKVIAEYRKKIKAVEASSRTTSFTISDTPMMIVDEKSAKTPKSSKKKMKADKDKEKEIMRLEDYSTPDLIQNRKYVIKDIKKTILVSMIMFALILGIWYAVEIQSISFV